MAAKPKPKPKRPASAPTPLLEWVSAGIGLVLILGAAALIGNDLIRSDDSPPRFAITTGAVQAAGAQFLVPVTVRNTGGSPAAAIVIEGVLTPTAGEPETAQATIDFIADQSSKKAGLHFQADPGAGRLTIAAKGYVEP